MYKIIGIMLLAMILLGLTGYFSYRKFSDMVRSISLAVQPDLFLVASKSLLNDLTEAENNVKSYTLTKDSTYLKSFYLSVDRVDSKLSQLKKLQKLRSDSSNTLDSVELLIIAKFNLLHDLLLLQDEFRVQVALDKVIRNVESAVIQETDAEVDQNESQEKKGIFHKIFNNKRKNRQVEPDDKVTLSRINIEVTEIKQEEKSIEEQIKNKELTLIIEDKKVSTNLTRQLNALSESELKYLTERAKNVATKLEDINRLIAFFCISLGILLLFLFFVIIDYVRNNRRYRRVLKMAKAHAEELAKAKERFIANISHEIRTPMNAIAGFTEQLSFSDLSENQKSQLEIIQKSIDHLKYLINDILDISRLQVGKIRFAKQNFEITEVINESINFIIPQAREKNLPIELHCEKLYTNVLYGDPSRLKQVLINLLSNAVKFTEKGKVTIEWKVEKHGSSEVELICRVIDTGIGMKSVQLAKVFQEFEQGDDDTYKLYGGSGLGLTISKMLVEALNGSIDIQSKVSEGTTVEIKLIYGRGNFKALPQDASTPEINLMGLKNKRMLIVDDEPYNRMLINAMMSNYGVILDEAVDGQDALVAVEENEYDLILMDARMPRLNGIDATKQIRSHPDNSIKSIPILILTAAVSDEDIENYKKIKISGIISKPIKEKHLILEINKILIPVS